MKNKILAILTSGLLISIFSLNANVVVQAEKTEDVWVNKKLGKILAKTPKMSASEKTLLKHRLKVRYKQEKARRTKLESAYKKLLREHPNMSAKEKKALRKNLKKKLGLKHKSKKNQYVKNSKRNVNTKSTIKHKRKCIQCHKKFKKQGSSSHLCPNCRKEKWGKHHNPSGL